MKRATIVCMIYAPGLSKTELYNKYKDCCPKGFKQRPYNGGQLNLAFEPDSSELRECIDYITRYKGNPDMFSRVQFTAKEIREAPFFQVNVPAPLELEGTFSRNYGTKHGGGCPKCGLGDKPIGDVFVDRKFIRKAEFGMIIPEFYVSERVLNLLEENKVTGYSVGAKIKDFIGREIPPNYVLDITSILPPVNSTTWLEPYGERCETCGKHRITYLRSDLQYDRTKLEQAKDINITCELLDNWRTPEVIVSAKVRNLFKENKVKVNRYTPITIVD